MIDPKFRYYEVILAMWGERFNVAEVMRIIRTYRKDRMNHREVVIHVIIQLLSASECFVILVRKGNSWRWNHAPSFVESVEI